jgi:hypothetical protein
MNYSLRHFVNREPQLAAFQARLQGREKSHVLLFHGPLGMGKTFMLYRLRALCREAKMTCALVDFQHDGLYTAEAIIHRLREQIGGDFFDAIGREIEALQRAFQELPKGEALAGWIGGGPLFAARPAPASQIEGRIGDVSAGGQAAVGQQIIQINNSQIYYAPEMAPAQVQQERTRRLSRALRDALERLVAREPVVLLFDACDSATPDAIQWLRNQLLDPLLDGSLASPGNLAIVLVGDPGCARGTWLSEIAGWGEGVAAYRLGDLPPEAVRQYWIEIRGLGEATLPPIFCTRGAPPHLMVQMANLTAEV